MAMTENERTAPLAPNVAQYKCYRKFLDHYYLYRKSQRAGFSFRRFAQMCGLHSPNYLQLVIKGQRNLSNEMAVSVAKAMREHLSAEERQYFVGLVRKTNATTNEELDRAERDLRVATKNLVAKYIPAAEAEVLGKWYHTLIREMLFLPDFEPSGEWISKRLRSLITSEQAEESLALLRKTGFVTEKDGKLLPAEAVLTTGHEVRSTLIRRMHAETLKTWARFIEDLDSNEREMGLLHIPIRSDLIPEFKDRIRRFQDEIIGWLVEHQINDPDQVAQLGIYLIPTAKSRLHKQSQ